MNGQRIWHATIVAILFTLAMTAVTGGGADAAPRAAGSSHETTVDCDGMASYRAAMIKAGKRWVKGMTRDGLSGRSSRTFTAAEWDDYAARATRLLDDLGAIDAPVFAGPWHDASLATARLKINLARSASLIGFDLTAELFANRVAATTAGLTTAREDTVAACADFAEFFTEWDGLDGQTAAADKPR